MSNTSTQTYVIYSKGIGSIDLQTFYSKIKPGIHISGGEITSVKFCTANKSASYLKCLTIAFRLFSKEGQIEESKPPTSYKFKRGRKITRVKLSGKALSIKIFKNGSIQVTGCKSIEHAKISIDMVFNLLNIDKVDELSLVSVMINVNFSIGFKINKEKLSEYFTEKNINVPPLTSGMGVKIRVPLHIQTDELLIPRMSWTKTEGFTDIGTIPYVSLFSEDIQKINKKFTACISIFHNGKILMSCVNDQAILVMSHWIKSILYDAKDKIEMKEHVIKTFKR